MLSDFKNFVNKSRIFLRRFFGIQEASYLRKIRDKNKTNIFWFLAIVLTALASFGAGYLMAPKNSQPAIIIQNPAGASVQEIIAPAPEEKSVPAATEKGAEEIKQQGKFVGSVNSNKYHLPDCPSAKKILPQNQIWFNSEEEAQKAGYVKCGNCGKQ